VAADTDCAHLVEADVLGLLTEALTAEVQVVLADETGLVLANAAMRTKYVSSNVLRLDLIRIERRHGS
jgi:hypothetical protein